MPIRRNPSKAGSKSKNDLAATLRSDASPMLFGQVRGLSREQLDVEVVAKGAPVPLGSEVQLTLTTALAPGPIALSAQCISRTDDQDRRTYGLRPLDLDTLDPQLTDTLYRIFNRRGAVRIPMHSAPAAVCARTGGERDLDRPARAALVDLSSTGAGFTVAGQVEQHLAAADGILLRFRLPGEEQVLQFAAVVRGRRLLEDVVLYGVEFDAALTPDFAQLKARIAEFVLRVGRGAEPVGAQATEG